MKWPTVDMLAKEMISKLEKNKAKGTRETWLKDHPYTLLRRLNEEVKELEDAIYKWSAYINLAPQTMGKEVAREAADVANFAMMIADRCNGFMEQASALMCEHANEVPANGCPCIDDCYCRTHTCK
jgi:NTP pyrophosphatase (non-canonical NTP hydrolase)